MVAGTTLLVAALLATAVHWTAAADHSDGKGSDSSQRNSAEKSGEDEEYGESKEKVKKSGQMHRFWIPTYQGANPLNRRKISITTSEMEKYDASIDMSLSGVNKNKTYEQRQQENSDTSSMPMLWSGDDRNKSYMVYMDSEGVTLEDSQPLKLPKQRETIKKTKLQETKVASSKLTKAPPVRTKPIKSKTVSSKPSKLSKVQKVDKPSAIINDLKSKATKQKYVEKSITTQFFEELGKVDANETLTPEYYKKLVKAATDNTKRKLGYNKITLSQTFRPKQKPAPEIIPVNIDSMSLELPHEKDEITFITNHEQITGKQQGTTLGKRLPKTKDSNTSTDVIPKENYKNNATHIEVKKAKFSQETLTPKKDEYDSTDELTDRFENKNKTVDKSHLSDFYDYSAYSDVLTQDKSQRRGKKRKIKKDPQAKPHLRSSEIQKWPGEEIKKKADEIREKQGKSSKKKKRKNEIVKKKIKKEKKKGAQEKDYKDQNDYDYPEENKKLRMRTTGEKNHAITEVKSYLKSMDQKYGGRPGQDSYKSKDRFERRGRQEDYDGYEGKYGREEKDWERRKGRDRRKGRVDRRYDWEYRRNDRGREERGSRGRERSRGQGEGRGWSRGESKGGGRGEFRGGDRGGFRGGGRGEFRGGGGGGFRGGGRGGGGFRGGRSSGRGRGMDSRGRRGSGRENRNYRSRGRGGRTRS